ncbi:MAG: DUF302 domain-containing protein [Pseudomonadota bacterium]
MIRRTVLMLMFAVALPGLAAANDDFVIKPSAHSVQETMDRLEAIVQEKDFVVIARVDHAAAAASVDMELAANQVLIFGKPALGTPLMAKNPLIGIDLPIKVVVYEDADGNVWLAYAKPEALIVERYGIEGEAERIEMMNKGLGGMTDAATSGG